MNIQFKHKLFFLSFILIAVSSGFSGTPTAQLRDGDFYYVRTDASGTSVIQSTKISADIPVLDARYFEKTAQGTILIIDDGDNSADTFFGGGQGISLVWSNLFSLGSEFQLETVKFIMRTETATENPVEIAIIDKNGNVLASGTLNMGLSENGGWYTINLSAPIHFNAGDGFSINLQSKESSITYPAAADFDAAIPNVSWYWDPNQSKWFNLNGVSGLENGSFIIRAEGTFITEVAKREEIPGQFELAQNYPNPFNPGTTISYTLTQSGQVELRIFNLLGQLVQTLVDENQSAGLHRISWNGRDSNNTQVESGLYFYQLRAGSYSQTRQMLLLK